MELKNRSLLIQKEELALRFKEETEILRLENGVLLRDLSLSKEELRGALAKGLAPFEGGAVSEFNDQLTTEMQTLKDEFRINHQTAGVPSG